MDDAVPGGGDTTGCMPQREACAPATGSMATDVPSWQDRSMVASPSVLYLYGNGHPASLHRRNWSLHKERLSGVCQALALKIPF